MSFFSADIANHMITFMVEEIIKKTLKKGKERKETDI
jgi:hypothetical protein